MSATGGGEIPNSNWFWGRKSANSTVKFFFLGGVDMFFFLYSLGFF